MAALKLQTPRFQAGVCRSHVELRLRNQKIRDWNSAAGFVQVAKLRAEDALFRMENVAVLVHWLCPIAQTTS